MKPTRIVVWASVVVVLVLLGCMYWMLLTSGPEPSLPIEKAKVPQEAVGKRPVAVGGAAEGDHSAAVGEVLATVDPNEELYRNSEKVAVTILFTTSKKTGDLGPTSDAARLLRFRVEQVMQHPPVEGPEAKKFAEDEMRPTLRWNKTTIFSFTRKHSIHFIALVTVDVLKDYHRILELGGWEVRVTPCPIRAEEIQNKQIAQEVVEDGAMGITEMVKVEGFRMREFTAVVMVDCDVFFHRNFEELFRLQDVGDLGWTHGGWDIEWVNGGFLVFHPKSKRSEFHYQRILELLREGDFRPGRGWKGSGVGWTYGGRTIQGLLPYYFLVELPALEDVPVPDRAGAIAALANTAGQRAALGVHGRKKSRGGTDVELDRCRYNNMVQLPKCKERVFSNVTSNHFTGDCVKPWWCGTREHPLCRRFVKEWTVSANEYAKSLGYSSYTPCDGGQYRRLPFPRKGS